jgi:hypothetical protein
MIKLGLTAAQIAMKAKKLPIAKLKKMFKEHFGINDEGLSKDQIATKLASAGQKSVMQSKNVVAAKNLLKGAGLTALGLSPFLIEDKAKTPRSLKGPSKSNAKPIPTPKKKPSTPPKAPPPKPDSVKKKKKQLMMKEKYTGKDSNVKFNSRGGMLKKGKK